MAVDGTHIGRRVREIRSFRGMSLTATAQLAGMAPSYLSMIERGLRPVNQRATLEALANALRVSPAELTGKPYAPTDAASEEAHGHIFEVEDAMTAWRIGEVPDAPARPWQQVSAELDLLNLTLRPNADYAAQGALLPSLIRDLLVAASDPKRRTAALVGLIATYKAVAYFAHDLGVAGLPVLAVERMREAAEELDDPVWLSYAAYQRAQLISGTNRSRQYDLAVQTAQLPGARVEVQGLAHLTAALACASRGDADAAQTHLAEATALADRIEPDVSPWMQTNFGRTNVGIWKVSIGLELGAGAKVREIGSTVRPAGVSKSRQAQFWIDVGRGLLTERKHRDQGLAALLEAEKLAPQKVRNNVFVRESVAGLLAQARREAGGRDLRGLAYRVGVAPSG
ncbi:Transcriptional regulator, contains XRE-family HTH domain [Lentzea jiangxiensis]|uniref:Transcriptional regulator, contains XRE-family HTH domain n=1 Tax=Lentzea jiangxiensis TaxID=641025 RepID=A0A1H0VQS5_9PSEU|nr:Transcriptional regulator, contains XRE-family HTH domain [Lentzea jiangxiensis]